MKGHRPETQVRGIDAHQPLAQRPHLPTDGSVLRLG